MRTLLEQRCGDVATLTIEQVDDATDFSLEPVSPGGAPIIVTCAGPDEVGFGAGQGVWTELHAPGDENGLLQELGLWVDAILRDGLIETCGLGRGNEVVWSKTKLRLADGRTVRLRTSSRLSTRLTSLRRVTLRYPPYG